MVIWQDMTKYVTIVEFIWKQENLIILHHWYQTFQQLTANNNFQLIRNKLFFTLTSLDLICDMKKMKSILRDSLQAVSLIILLMTIAVRCASFVKPLPDVTTATLSK